jgi:hypothetical protein
MPVDKKDDDIEVLLAKVVVNTVIIVLWLVFVIFAPKTVFAKDLSYQLATSMAIVSAENMMLYDYDVYSTEQRFNTGLINDLQEVKKAFHDRSEVLAVKIYGTTSILEVKDDYILIISPDTLELNIEYYLVKDMEFNDTNIPIRTFIMLFDDVSKLANTVYLAIFLIVAMSIFTPVSIKLTKHSVRLIKMNKLYQKEETSE